MKNLLFLLADQFRFDALGAENPLVQTPHLDALAEAGARFTRAYTPLPVCAPARQALYTGRHPDSFGAYWNYGFFPTPPISPEGAWPRALKAMGYSCGFIGKWNVSPADGPEAFGYDTVVSAAQYSDGGAQYTGGWLGCESPVPLEQAKTHWLADRAIEFIGAQRGPWHLFVDIGMPHLPCRPSAPFSRMYDPAAIPEWPGWNDTFENKPFAHEQQAWNWNLEAMPWAEMAGQVARYYGMVSQIDDAIGRILRHVDLRDTLVVFTSDHGDMCGNHRMLDKHCTLYQDIVRVPLILAGPGVEEEGAPHERIDFRRGVPGAEDRPRVPDLDPGVVPRHERGRSAACAAVLVRRAAGRQDLVLHRDHQGRVGGTRPEPALRGDGVVAGPRMANPARPRGAR